MLSLRDVPFPPARDPAGLAAAGVVDDSARKRLVRKALLRFHPDKWASVLGKVQPEEMAALHDRLRAITQSLIELKETMG